MEDYILIGGELPVILTCEDSGKGLFRLIESVFTGPHRHGMPPLSGWNIRWLMGHLL